MERNLALKVEPGSGADEFIVCGRGTLHIGILIENMRREGYEFQVGPPKVITKTDADGKKLEPYEDAVVEVPEEHMGSVMDLMGQRKAEMLDMAGGSQGCNRLTYRVPTRALLGLRNQILTATKVGGRCCFVDNVQCMVEMSVTIKSSCVQHNCCCATCTHCCTTSWCGYHQSGCIRVRPSSTRCLPTTAHGWVT